MDLSFQKLCVSVFVFSFANSELDPILVSSCFFSFVSPLEATAVTVHEWSAPYSCVAPLSVSIPVSSPSGLIEGPVSRGSSWRQKVVEFSF